ncbi:TIGR00730 family Rossman fold protein [Lacihabitans sp. LS3-19]|uniref:LOG family protein n=1 Tax=Lacihabitans sp. LS3-19 TaxID=2487335 RepID=UPI0020CCA32E|nr:TIGR00730 family Rossman fold protein [Lacihabitans sp. LS3-19]MCP9767811.1 TIGR00730 family Rossman fold protein [Lacihabitans sp. LS3-19]
MKSILVYCGSNMGKNEIYKNAAISLGLELVKRNIKLVYGGGNRGLMGEISRTVMKNGGYAIGVMPDFLVKMEVASTELSEMIIVETMHQRKSKMEELCDGVITLPGGFGSMDELFEILTWGQLGLHKKPVGILNVNGFYDHLLAQMDFMVDEGFLKKENRNLLVFDENIDSLLNKMSNFNPEYSKKWMDKDNI